MLNQDFKQNRIQHLIPAIKAKLICALIFPLLLMAIIIYYGLLNWQANKWLWTCLLVISFSWIIAFVFLVYQIIKYHLLFIDDQQLSIWEKQKQTIIIQCCLLNLMALIFLIWQAINRHNYNYLIKQRNGKHEK